MHRSAVAGPVVAALVVFAACKGGVSPDQAGGPRDGEVISTLVIFDDSFRNDFQTNEMGEGCVVSSAWTAQVASGSAALALQFNDYCTTYLYRTARFAAGEYTHLEFDVYGQAPLETEFDIALASNHYTALPTRVPMRETASIESRWQRVRIPLSSFNVSPEDPVAGFRLRHDEPNITGRGNVIFDNVAFVKLRDVNGPRLVSARNTDLQHVAVVFDELLDRSSAQAPEHFLVRSAVDDDFAAGVAPTRAELNLAGREVLLTLPVALKNDTLYTVSVRDVLDQAPQPNPVAPGTFASFTASLRTATLTVDAATVVRPFDDRMRGAGMATWMHAARRKPYPGDIPKLVELSKQIRVGVVRFGGGNWANGVVWDRTNTVTEWTTADRIYNADQMDSLARFSQATGSEVMIQTNVCANDPQMWADLLRYTNVEHDYGFKYWEVGSENNYDTCQDGMTAAQLAERFLAYREALLAVDPTVRVVGPATAGLEETWIRPVVDAAHASGKDLDGVIWHWYPTNEGYSTIGCDLDYGPTPRLLFDYRTAFTDCWHPLSEGATVPDDHWLVGRRRRFAEVSNARLRNEILSQSPDTFIGISELNTLAGVGDNALEGNHVAALWFADMLGRLAYSGTDFTTMYNLYDGTYYGLIYPIDDVNPTDVHVRPTYYTYLLYARWFGDQMVRSESSDPNQQVTVWAARDSATGELRLMVVNMTDRSVEATIALHGFEPSAGAYYELASADPLDSRTVSAEKSGTSTINGAAIDTATVSSIAQSIAAIPARPLAKVGPGLKHTFPAYTATAVVLH